MIFLGVDPGASGGIAAVDGYGDYVDFCRGDATDADIVAFLRKLSTDERVFAAVEQVGAKPRIGPAGRVSMGAKSAFSFGGSYARLRMALTACDIPYDLVLPAIWQKSMGCLSRGDKNVTKRRAQEIWPAVKVTHGKADAMLLAEYRRRSWV